MTEIHVQRRRPSLWPAILGALALVLIIGALANWAVDVEPVNETASVPAVPETVATSGVSAPPAEVAAFLTFAAAREGVDGGPAHDYTAAGIRHLSSALDTLALEKQIDGNSVTERLQALRQAAQRIQQNPEASGHSDQVTQAFLTAADVMAAMQENRWMGAEDLRNAVERVRAAAGAIDAGRPLLEQLGDVRAFFDRAAVVVRDMAERV